MNERPQNPYIAGLPIRNKDDFFGREELIKSIQKELLNPSMKILVLYGQRRIGKTSIQLQLREELNKESYLPIYFDLQDWAERPLGQLLFELARQTIEFIDPALNVGNPNNYDNAGKYFQSNFIPRVKAALGVKRRLVYLFDEFDTLDTSYLSATAEAAGKTLFSFIKKLIDEVNNLVFIFVVGRQAEDLPEKYQSIFKAAHIKEVWTLNQTGAEKLIRKAEDNGSLQFTLGGFERILALTNGHPYMTQLLCQRAWELAYQDWEIKDSVPVIDEILINNAVVDTFKSGEAAFVWLWDGISNEEKIFAAAFAENSQESYELKQEDVLRILRENSKLLRISNQSNSAERLVKRHILKRVEGGSYLFDIELFRLWIKQNRPLDIVKRNLDQLNPEAEDLFQTGKKLLDKNNLEQAQSILKEALSIDPQHLGARLKLSEVFLAENDIDGAYREAQNAYLLDTEEAKDFYLQVLQRKGQIEYEKRSTTRAISISQQILNIEPDNDFAINLIRRAESIRQQNIKLVANIILLILIIAGVPAFLLLYRNSSSLIIAIVSTVVYEIVVLVIGFLVRVWQRIEIKWVTRVSDWLELTSQTVFSGYRRRFLEYIIYQYRSFDVKGLSTQGPYNLELETVYVELGVDPTTSHSVSSNPVSKLPERFQVGRHTIWEYITNKNVQNYVMLGAPGSGKTTLLKHMALTLAGPANRRRKLDVPEMLPILLFLRDHATTIKENPSISLAQLIRDQFENRQAPIPPTGWLEVRLRRGECLIMFDGLDEVADIETRKQVVIWVERCMAANGNNRFILSSRPHGYKTNPIGNVTVLLIRPFSTQQVEQFIQNWYLANEIMSSQKDDPGVREEARRGATDLIGRLRSTTVLSDLAINPLLLTMITTVHRYRSSLPGRRVELYSEIFEVFLGKREQALGLRLDMTPAQKVRVLRQLAYSMMEKELRIIDRVDVLRVIAKPLLAVNPRIKVEEFLENVENSSGLIVEFENGKYSFSHLTFQEYLASIHVIETRLEKELLKQVENSWWHETIRLYCAQTDASNVISSCLNSLNPTTLSLAIECMDEAREISPDTRAQYETVMEKGVEDPDPERRKLIAKAWLKRRTG